MIWLAVFPTLTVINLALGDWLRTLSPVLRTFVLATIAVPIVIYGLMPQLHRLRVQLMTRVALQRTPRRNKSGLQSGVPAPDSAVVIRRRSHRSADHPEQGATPMLVRLADWCYRRRRLVVLAWVAALAASFALASAFGGELRQDYLQPGSESKAASETLQESFPQRSGDTVQIVVRSDAGVSSPDVKARAEKIFADVADSAHVVSVTSPFTDEGAQQISADGKTAYADVVLDKNDNEFTVAEAKTLVEPILAAGGDGMQVEVGGPVAALSQTAPVGTEGIGLIAAIIILLITFGSAVAMGLPVVTALFGLSIALLLGEVLRRVVDVPDWAPATAAMVGLGVGIDYALLIVTRYRNGLAQGLEPRRATVTAMSTAGRSVLFAGIIVMISMLGILLVGQPALTGFSFTVVLALLVVMAASLTLCRRSWASQGATSSACMCPSSARKRTPTTRRAGIGGVASSSAGRGLPPSADLRCCWRSPHRSWASGSVSPMRRTTRRASRVATPMTCCPTGSVLASPRRSCSRSKGPRAPSWRARQQRSGPSSVTSPEWHWSPPLSSTQRATPRC